MGAVAEEEVNDIIRATGKMALPWSHAKHIARLPGANSQKNNIDSL